MSDIAVDDIVLIVKSNDGLNGCLCIVSRLWPDNMIAVHQPRRGAPMLDDGIYASTDLIRVGRMPDSHA